MLNPWSKSLLIPYARIIEFRFQGLSRYNRDSQLLSTPSRCHIILIDSYNTNIKEPEKQFVALKGLLGYGDNVIARPRFYRDEGMPTKLHVIARPFRHKSEGEAIWVGRGVPHLPDCHVAALLAMTDENAIIEIQVDYYGKTY